MKWLKAQREDKYKVFNAINHLHERGIRRIIALDPKRTRAVLDTRDVSVISKYYHYMDEMVSIRRSPASVLVRNEQGDTTLLKAMMPKHKVKTVELRYEGEEEVEAQCMHRVFVR